MYSLERVQKSISAVMSAILVGGLFLTTPAGGVTAQGMPSAKDQKKNVVITENPSTLQSIVFQNQPDFDREMEKKESERQSDNLFSKGEPSLSVYSTVYGDVTGKKTVTQTVYSQFRTKSKAYPLLGADIVKEDISKRTANSKHYLLKDGSYRAVISSGYEHYLDANAEFQEIVPFLVDDMEIYSMDSRYSKEGIAEVSALAQESQNSSINKRIALKENSFYRALQVPFDVKIPKKYNQGYSMKKGDYQLYLTPIGASNVVGSVYDSQTVTYQNVWNNVDATLAVSDIGVKETLILKTPAAPTSFLFQVNGSLDGDFSAGEMHIQPAWLEDSNGTTRRVAQEIINKNGKQYLQLNADVSGLHYPVIIDPTVTITGAIQDTSLNTYYTDSVSYGRETSSFVNIGKGDFANYISLFQFNLSQIPTNSIRSALLRLFIAGGYNEYQTQFDIYRITAPWEQARINKVSDIPPVATDYISGSSGPYGTSSIGAVQGFSQLDITSYVQLWLTGTPNYGVKIASNANNSNKTITSTDFPTAEYQPKLIVDYNLPPTVPILFTPNGGEVIDKTYTITWGAANDEYTTQNNLKYDVEYSINGGTTWSSIVTSLSGQTSYTYDFSSVASSSTAYIRVRAFDGMSYSSYDQSNAPFTILHNRAPNAPSGLAPGSTSSTAPTFVAGVTPTLNWTFSDPDAGDTQSAYQVLLYNTSNGLVYDSGWVTSSAKSFTVPTNKLVRGTAYYWKVLVKDSKGAASSASNAMYIKCNTIPTLNLTSYANNTSVPDNVLTFTWTFTDGDGQAQSGVQIQGSKDSFATIAYNSGTINGTATSFTTPALASGTWSFRVMASDGVEWSAYSQRTGLSLPNTFEPNDSTTTATPVSYGTYTTLINSTTDVDFFKYTATTTGVNRVQLTPPAGKNYDVYVYDSSNTLLAAGVRSVGVSENIIYEVAAGSTYYVKVVGASGEYSTTATYSLTISNVNFKTQTTYDYDSNGNLKTKTTTVVP